MRFILAVLIGLGLAPAFAHEGHDHGAPPPTVSATAAPRTEAASATVEAVIIAGSDRLDIYLDEFATNAPITDAIIEVDVQGQLLVAEAAGEGMYQVPYTAGAGAHDLVLTVIAGAGVDVLAATLTVPEAEVAAVPATSEPAEMEPVLEALTARLSPVLLAGLGGLLGGLFIAGLFLRRKPTAAAVLAFALPIFAPDQAGAEVANAASVQPPARVVQDVAQRMPSGATFVPMATQRLLAIRTIVAEEGEFTGTLSLPGRVVPDPNASGYVQASLEGRLVPPEGGFPQMGQRVEKGQVLATVAPTLGAVDAVDLEQQRRTLDQEIALITQKLDRLKRMESAVPKAQIADAETELAGLTERRAALEGGTMVAERLTAPVSGIIASGRAVAGQIASPGATIFEIADPSALWVEALSFTDAAFGGEATAVRAEGEPFTLEFIGSGIADAGQATPVLFKVVGEAPALRAGQLVTVLAESGSKRKGVALPREAVVRAANGQSLVYAQTGAESFEAREVRVEPLDGERVVVVAGIDPGTRVVTQGSELLNQIR